jgi:3D (Asp-Asp-Asp) domain-containing protein
MLAIIRMISGFKISHLKPMHVRILALGCIVTFVGVGSQLLVNVFADTTGLMTLKVAGYATQGRMADGNSIYAGACAVSTAQFPLGTVLALYNADGSLNRQCTAEDTSASITPDQIYLAMPGNDEGVSHWGVRMLMVQVLRWGWGAGNPPELAPPVVPKQGHYLMRPLRSHFVAD